MDYSYLENIEQLSSLYDTLKNDSSNDSPYIRCIKYGRNIEQLVRYVFSVKFPKNNVANSEIIKLIKDSEFKKFLGKTDYYNKIHFIYLAGNNAAFDHDVDKETADLALVNLRESTYIIFSKLKDFTEEEETKFQYVAPPSMQISEAKTRELYIDVNLKNAKYKLNKYKDSHGHGIPQANQVCVEIEVHNLPNQSVGYIDYVIYGRTGLPLAVIEAKRTSISEEAGAQQAKDYADALKKELNLKYRPIVYYTNGYTIKIQDRLGYPARVVGNFASLDDLELMIKRQLPGDEDRRKPIADKTIDQSIINRSKLVEAVKELIDSMNTDGKMRRKGLLVLPCGVGKTRTAVALSKILLKNDWAQNILFLADRNNLVSNAEKPFKKYIDGVVSDISAENPNRDINARVCICTYQSMLSFINKPNKDFSVGHFDLIIVDEAHRSLFNVYRAIFEYFDSFVIGLTATPSKALDRSTYEILDLKVDEPTFEVKFEEAVNLDYLVSYKAFDKTSKLLSKGLKYSELSDEEKAHAEEVGIFGDVSPSEFKKTIMGSGKYFNETTIDEMFADLFKYGLRVDSGNRIGKTLIFARDHKHAEKIVERFKLTYPNLGDEFCQVIDNQVKKNKTRQDNFAKKDSNPHIVVSVDMMDTGVDIPEIVNLVFFKNVLSRIKFDQMWGRGTRTCENLNVISPSKDYFEGRSKDDTRIEYKDKQGFFVFDYCANFQFFDEHPEGNDPSVCPNLNQKQYMLNLAILKNLQDIKYQEQPKFKAYYENLKSKLIRKISELDTNRVDVHGKLAYIDKFKIADNWACISDKDIYEIESNLVNFIDSDTLDDTGYRSWEYKLTIVQSSVIDENVDSRLQQMQMMRIAKKLLTKASIQEIFDKKDRLKEISGEEYYNRGLDFFDLENLKSELGPLMRYLDDGGESEPILTGFNDKIETSGRDGKYDFDDFRTYREKFILYLQKHYGELTSIKKILDLDSLNNTDLKELQDILNMLKRDEDQPLFQNNEELIVFIRKIIGLDRKMIDDKCATFLNEQEFNKDQRSLINLIIDFAIRNGNITNDDLVNSEPFSDYEIPELFKDKGLEPLFSILGLFNNSLSIGA